MRKLEWGEEGIEWGKEDIEARRGEPEPPTHSEAT